MTPGTVLQLVPRLEPIPDDDTEQTPASDDAPEPSLATTYETGYNDGAYDARTRFVREMFDRLDPGQRERFLVNVLVGLDDLQLHEVLGGNRIGRAARHAWG